jgi:hypothetical protein
MDHDTKENSSMTVLTANRATNERRAAQDELAEAEREVATAKFRLVNGADVTTEDLNLAFVRVQRAELLLTGATEREKRAKARAAKSDDYLSEFVLGVIEADPYAFKLHNASVSIARETPMAVPDGRAVVIVQTENTETHGSGVVSGTVRAYGYGGAKIEQAAFREQFKPYGGKLKYGNVPSGVYTLTFEFIEPPEPVVTKPSAARLAEIVQKRAGRINQRPGSYDNVRISVSVMTGHLQADAQGDRVTAAGAVRITLTDRFKGYSVNEIADKVRKTLGQVKPGTFIHGLGRLESLDVTKIHPNTGGGVDVHFVGVGITKELA